MYRITALPFLVVMVLLVAACAGPATPAPSTSGAGAAATSAPAPTSAPAATEATQKQFVKLVVGDSASITLHSLPAIAMAKGFDKAEGIELETRTFPSGAAMVEAVAAGELQVAQAGDTPFTSLAASGTPVKMIAQMTDSGANYTFWVKKELNPQKPEDLLDHTFGLPFGSTSQLVMNGFIETYNLDPARMKQVDMKPNDIVAAYTKGDIDGFILWSPGSNRAAQARPSVKVHDAYQSYFPDKPGPQRLGTAHTVIFAREELLKEQPEVVQAYLRTLLRAKKFLDDPATAGEARQIVADSLKIDKSIVEETKDQIIFQLDINQQLIDDLTLVGNELYKANKIKNPPDLKAWMDSGPLAAVAPELVNLTGSKTSTNAAPAKDVGSLVVGYTPSVSIGTLLVLADAQGFDKEEGLDMTLQRYATSPVEAEAVAAGDLQIGGMGDTTIIGLEAAGVLVKMAAQLVDVSRQVEIICRQDRNITKPKDLEGKTIGYGFGGLAHNLVAKFISTYELNDSSVKQIDGKPAELVAAYVKGDFDCIALWPPGLFQAKEQVPSVRLHNGRESFIAGQEGPKNIMGSHSNLFATDKVIKEQPEAVQALMHALLKSIDFLHADPDQAAEIVAADFKVKPEEVRDGFDLLDFKLTIDEEFYQDMNDTAQFFYNLGRLKAAPPPMLKGWVDPTLLKQVDPSLVTYEP
ncbi:MAG: ABC transporter substrate-binding protein [Ardenticatenaceae bacterium]|nr:ABC transporter substrate-binding protein [Ardenticatenaceae bacterium]